MGVMGHMRQYVAPVARLTAFVAVLGAGLGYLDYRAAEASVSDRLLNIGQRMAPYLDDGRSTEAPRQVRINGVPLLVAAGHTTHPPAFVKKWYKDRYAAAGDGLAQLAGELQKKGLPPDVALNQLTFGDDQHGGVAALDFGRKLTIHELQERMMRFVKSNDLGDLARLRYVWYEADGHGGTRFLTVWTDDRFNISRVMPLRPGVDAEGKDLDGVPRYPGTTRILSAEEKGTPEKLAVYNGPGSAVTAQLFYEARMETLGWARDLKYQDLAVKHGRTQLRFEKAAHEVLVDLSDNGGGQGVTVVHIQTR
jgi:hypothetical protein